MPALARGGAGRPAPTGATARPGGPIPLAISPRPGRSAFARPEAAASPRAPHQAPKAVQRRPDGLRPTTALALAAATGSPRRLEADGRASVVFGPSRSPGATRPAPTPRVQRVDAAQATPAVAPAAPARSPAGVADADIDTVYEVLLERLRRELVIERERLGDMYSRLR